jgi:hypothetical protein
MSTPSDRFAEHYRAHVQPRIAKAVEIAALDIALDNASFGDRLARIRARAWRLGGSQVEPELWSDLEAWILDRLAERTAAVADEVDAQAATAARIAVQVAAWDRATRAVSA